ncbi:MAG: ATP-binding cassette domain-containing protein [Clostridiales bacterium]|nr:ATP-binding cassette domain-containing protein [Clostridiales bacterium]
MIEVKNLTKIYGQHHAVDGISFKVEEGEILGFLGPNGAGKTTTMNILTGYISATSGEVLINGIDVLDRPEEAKRNIGYLPEFPPLYMDMTVSEYLDFVSKIKNISDVERHEAIEAVMAVTRIEDMKNRLVGNLSKGYKQRVGLAQAILGTPKVLILDEPTVGLDPKQIIEIRNLIKNLGKKHTVILSSHILSEVSAVCDRVVIINKGSIVASDTPDNLSKQLQGANKLQIRVAAPEKQAMRIVRDIPGITNVQYQAEKEKGTSDIIVESAEDVDIRKIVFNGMAKANCPLLIMRPLELSLEDIFLKVTHLDKEV